MFSLWADQMDPDKELTLRVMLGCAGFGAVVGFVVAGRLARRGGTFGECFAAVLACTFLVAPLAVVAVAASPFLALGGLAYLLGRCPHQKGTSRDDPPQPGNR